MGLNSRKGLFFTFMALFLIVLILASISTKETFRYYDRATSVAVRVETLNDFSEDLEKEVDRELFIGGYRSLISLNSYMRIVQGYLPDLDYAFTEILMNGSVNGTELPLMTQSGQGADIRSWTQRINEEASKLNVHVNFSVHDITLEHGSPWTVNIILNATSVVADARGSASITLNKLYTKEFTIFGFEDPLYTIGTGDLVTILMNQTPDTDFVKAGNDTSTLQDHIHNSFYISSTKAPSWLMRFSGNLSPSEFGIESIVDPEYINAQGIPVKERSLVDYIYFGDQTTTDYCNFQNMPVWFRIDSEHLADYGLTGLTKGACS
jgi:hypothetical protein